MKYILPLLLVFSFFSCKNSEKEKFSRLLHEWNDRTILFPDSLKFSTLGEDAVVCSISQSNYTIIAYTGNSGCISCKLQLKKWKKFIDQLALIEKKSVSVLFFLHPKDERELIYILKQDKFNYPVCFDSEDAFNKLNKLPKEEMFQTFLLDKDNKVIAIGNPISNPKVKELYLKIIMGDKAPKKNMNILTDATCSDTIINMGAFDWNQEQKPTFTLMNTGNNPLVVTDVITSCGCTTVDYGKEPVRPGSGVKLKVHYKADHPEHFNKTITVYYNAEKSPIKLRITGNAE